MADYYEDFKAEKIRKAAEKAGIPAGREQKLDKNREWSVKETSTPEPIDFSSRRTKKEKK